MTVDQNFAGEFIEVQVLRRRDEAEGIICLELAAPRGTLLPPFEAGAHVDVHVGSGIVRQYSLCNDPSDSRLYRLGIMLEAQSRGGSAGIHARFAEGETIRIGLPRNNFRLVPGAALSVLAAGGIGITPLLAMAYRLSAEGAPFELHFCTRSRSRTPFLQELTAGSLAERARIHHDDGPAEQRFDLDRDLPPPNAGTHLYICGPTGFMDWLIDGARARGWSNSHLHTEYFTNQVSADGDSFIVEARLSGKEVLVPSGTSIVEALAAIGVYIPTSCEEGVCGTCLTEVIEGLPDHRDAYQTEEERASNKRITPCCSRARSPRLVLDV